MKYVARPRVIYLSDQEEVSVTADQIIESEGPEYISTGIVNAQGLPLYRSRDRIPFGFVGRKT